MASQKGPVGDLFFAFDKDGHDAEVVTIGVEYDAVNCQIGAVTFLVIDLLDNEEPRIRLQRFRAKDDPQTIPLSPEELHLLIRESGILLERRFKSRRR